MCVVDSANNIGIIECNHINYSEYSFIRSFFYFVFPSHKLHEVEMILLLFELQLMIFVVVWTILRLIIRNYCVFWIDAEQWPTGNERSVYSEIN